MLFFVCVWFALPACVSFTNWGFVCVLVGGQCARSVTMWLTVCAFAVFLHLEWPYYMNLTRLQVDWPVNLSMPHQDRWLHTYSIAGVYAGLVPFLLFLDISWWVTKLEGDKWAAVNQVDASNDLKWVVWFSVTGRTGLLSDMHQHASIQGSVVTLSWMHTQSMCWISHLCFIGLSYNPSSAHIFIPPTAGHNPSSRHGICLPPLPAPVCLAIHPHSCHPVCCPAVANLPRGPSLHFKRASTLVGLKTCTAASDCTEPRRDQELPRESCSINNFLHEICDRSGLMRGVGDQRMDRGRQGVGTEWWMDTSRLTFHQLCLCPFFCGFSQSLH